MADVTARGLRSGMQRRGRDLSRLAAREALREAVDQARDVRMPATVIDVADLYEYDPQSDGWVQVPGVVVVYVEVDGDADDAWVRTDLTTKQPTTGDRVMVEFRGHGGVVLDELVGGHV